MNTVTSGTLPSSPAPAHFFKPGPALPASQAVCAVLDPRSLPGPWELLDNTRTVKARHPLCPKINMQQITLPLLLLPGMTGKQYETLNMHFYLYFLYISIRLDPFVIGAIKHKF